MTNCSMANVALPLWVGDATSDAEVGAEEAGDEKKQKRAAVPHAHAAAATNWMMETIMTEHTSFVPLFVMAGRWWCRLSAQVYLDLDDYEATGAILADICSRAGKGEYTSYDKL